MGNYKGHVDFTEHPDKKRHSSISIDNGGAESLICDDNGEPITVPGNWTDTQEKSLQGAWDTLVAYLQKQGLPVPKGMVMFSFNSPGCGYYWIGGRLVYR